MDNNRNLGVTEARFALTLLICVLVAVGYVVLLRLGGTGETVEIRPEVDPRPPAARVDTPTTSEDQPLVLTVETTETAPAVRTSQLPDRATATHRENATAPPDGSSNPQLR